MCYTVIPTPKFEKDLDYYERKNKFTKIYDYVDEVVRELEKGNLIVNVIKNLKYDTLILVNLTDIVLFIM